MKYIGGEIELVNPDNAVTRIRNKFLENYHLLSTGRTAIKYILQKLDAKYPVLLPSFLCESIIQPFKEMQFPYRFYRIKNNLEIDLDYLKDILSIHKISAIYVIHFFGFNTDISVINEIRKMQLEIRIIEDCTHVTYIPAELNEFEYIGDIIFGSLRKTFPIGDGAFLLDSDLNTFIEPKNSDTGFSQLKYWGKKLRWLYLNEVNNTHLESIYLGLLKYGEDEIVKEIPNTAISTNSKRILENLDIDKVYNMRRRNFQFLAEKFERSPIISQYGFVMPVLKNGDMPYMLPFFVNGNNRNRLRINLRDNGIFTAIIWRLPDEILARPEFHDSVFLSDHILCFHIDQRYALEDLMYSFNTFCRVLQNG